MSKSRRPAPAGLRRQLARELSSILNNPECPRYLYNNVAEAVCEMSNDLTDAFWHSPEQIERDINAHVLKVRGAQ